VPDKQEIQIMEYGLIGLVILALDIWALLSVLVRNLYSPPAKRAH